jgi:hypothetical protein
MRQYMALGAVLAALGAGGAALEQAAAGAGAARQNDGGLSVLPAIVEHAAQPGPLATLTVANRSAAPLAVTITPRAWKQSSSGKVAADRRSTLPGVSVATPEFMLAPGASQDVPVTLDAVPSAGALYGALEVVGLPTDVDKRKGVVLGYRLISTLRVLPAVPKLRLVAGKIKASKRKAVLPVRNAGNTIDEVTGKISVKTSRGTRNTSLKKAVKILPGKRVDVPLASRLRRGRATVKVTLYQRGKAQLKLTKRFRVK